MEGIPPTGLDLLEDPKRIYNPLLSNWTLLTQNASFTPLLDLLFLFRLVRPLILLSLCYSVGLGIGDGPRGVS